MVEVLRMAAFADGPDGGNPAGVVLDAGGLNDVEMLRTAADLGYAETAFVVDGPADGAATLRCFSPVAEVPFCGHATAATAVALAARFGTGRIRFVTPAGTFDVETRADADGTTASFIGQEPVVGPVEDAVLDRLLAELGLDRDALAGDHPPRLSFTGNTHPVLVLRSWDDFEHLAFDPARLRALMVEQGWFGTVTVLLRTGPLEYEACNPFPVGTMDEDPATGSAAASTGAYLRAIGRIHPPATVLIRQGRHVGRRSVLLVDVPETGPVRVTGGATVIPDAEPSTA